MPNVAKVNEDAFSKSLYSTLDYMRSYRLDGNNQLVSIKGHTQLSARDSNLLKVLYGHGWNAGEVGFAMFNSPDEDVYGNKLSNKYKVGIFEFKRKTIESMATDYSKFDPKEFWNYLHEEWQFCDVLTHANGNSLESYRRIKGALYEAFIKNHLNAESLKGKKILEIGPGYGLFPSMMKRFGIKSKYWCLDLVQRFDHDNFVVGNGMEFPESLNERFDVIFMLDAYGHIPASAMENYIEKAMNMLSDNGRILINTVSIEKPCLFFGTVTYPLSLSRLRGMVEGAGFVMSKEKFFITETFSESDITIIRRKTQ